jgi:WD40 repeat protein
LADNPSYIAAIAISGDGKAIAAGSGDGTINVWDTATGQLQYILSDHTDGVNGVAFGPNDTIVSVSGDETLRIWSLASQ